MLRWLRRALLFVAVLIGCVPITAVLAIVLTPVLWKLEDVVHIELAGHSGPSDWVLYALYAVVVAAVFGTALRISRKRTQARQ
jgi:hypothetical protein